MKRNQRLRALVTERLTAAAEEIFALVERTIGEYEEELCRSKEENQRRQQLLEETQRREQLLEENQRREQLLEEVLKPHEGAGETSLGLGDTKTEEEEEEEEHGLRLKQENVECTRDPCSPWQQQHFHDFPPNLDYAKPEPGIHFTKQEYFHPGESESGSDPENADEEPLINEAEQRDFYQQNELESLGDKPSPGSSNVIRKAVRPPKQCAVCGKIFGNLRRHMIVHTGEKPYSCSVCEKRFTRKGSLQSHMAVHRGDTPFRCSLCGKMFSQRGHLQTHAAMHSGEKPFSCSVCGAQFSSNALLLRHRRVHTGIRPFSCPFCDRGFTRNEHLRRHVKTHAGTLDVVSTGN